MQFANSYHKSTEADIDNQIYLIEYYSMAIIMSAIFYKLYLSMETPETEHNVIAQPVSPALLTNSTEQARIDAYDKSRDAQYQKVIDQAVPIPKINDIVFVGRLCDKDDRILKWFILDNNGQFTFTNEKTVKAIHRKCVSAGLFMHYLPLAEKKHI